MSITKDKQIEEYYEIIKNWDYRSKKQLIIKLIDSLDYKSIHKKEDDFSGVWEDNRTADEIIEDIYNSRVNYSNIEDFE